MNENENYTVQNYAKNTGYSFACITRSRLGYGGGSIERS
jgi:hypothetical protein